MILIVSNFIEVIDIYLHIFEVYNLINIDMYIYPKTVSTIKILNISITSKSFLRSISSFRSWFLLDQMLRQQLRMVVGHLSFKSVKLPSKKPTKRGKSPLFLIIILFENLLCLRNWCCHSDTFQWVRIFQWMKIIKLRE